MKIGEVVEILIRVKDDYGYFDYRRQAVEEACNLLDKLPRMEERRIMKAINKYKDAKGGVYVSGVTKFEEKRTFKDDAEKELYESRVLDKVNKGDRLPGEHYSMQTMTASTADLVARLEKELTSVQAQKTKAVDALAKLRMEKRKEAGESKGNELVRTWAESVIKARRENDG